MSNFAALIAPLSISGSRLSDGSPNASGKVWFFEPGGNTPVNVYSDAEASAIVTQPVILTEGGLVSRSDYPDGIFATQPIRLYIEDSDANVASDTIYIPATAGDVGVSNDATTATTLDEWITQAQTSTGGTDFKYLIASGQTERPIGDTITELVISVKAFGAVGDNNAIDTTAVQAALNFAKSEGGGVVYFPPGTYKIDQALTLSSASGVTIRGAGKLTSTVIQTAAANGFTLTSCTDPAFEYLRVMHSSTAAAASGIAAATCTNLRLTGVTVQGGDFGTGLSTTGNGGGPVLIEGDSVIGGITTCASFTDTATVSMVNSTVTSAAGNGILYAGNTASCYVGNVFFNTSAGTGVTFTGTGTKFTIEGSPSLGACTTPIDWSALTTDPILRQWGNQVDGYVTSQASGGGGGSAFTPDRSKGQEIHLRLTSGGAAVCTLAAPTKPPATTMRNTRLTLRLTAAAGGNITWTFNAVYILVGGGATIVGTDGNTDIVEFQWDVQTSEWRECFRSATAT